MMRVTDTFLIKGRGLLFCVESDGPCPLNGSQLRRVSDGQIWTVTGVERFGIKLGTIGYAGEKLGLLVSGVHDAKIGDELVRVEQLPPNIYNAPRTVSHASLAKLSEDSDYKVECPACPSGMLLVRRDQVSLRLVRVDRCISCGQIFVYTDAAIGGEAI